jgi:hypothetical protein
MLGSPLSRVFLVLSSLLWIGAANFPDALCLLPHWPSC